MLIGGKVSGDSLRTELMKKCGRVVETGAEIHATALRTLFKKIDDNHPSWRQDAEALIKKILKDKDELLSIEI